MKIIEYITVTHIDQYKFVETVNDAIKKGYSPFGGISVATSGNELIQMQALVKYEV